MWGFDDDINDVGEEFANYDFEHLYKQKIKKRSKAFLARAKPRGYIMKDLSTAKVGDLEITRKTT